jgi:predicted phage-related endonuclease
MSIIKDLESVNNKVNDIRDTIERLGIDNDIDVSDIVDDIDTVWNEVDDVTSDMGTLKDYLDDIKDDVERRMDDIE